ncbi:MAG: hypothetical protein ACP5VQ_09670 [Phycisphaerae bacterium]
MSIYKYIPNAAPRRGYQGYQGLIHCGRARPNDAPTMAARLKWNVAMRCCALKIGGGDGGLP